MLGIVVAIAAPSARVLVTAVIEPVTVRKKTGRHATKKAASAGFLVLLTLASVSATLLSRPQTWNDFAKMKPTRMTQMSGSMKGTSAFFQTNSPTRLKRIGGTSAARPRLVVSKTHHVVVQSRTPSPYFRPVSECLPAALAASIMFGSFGINRHAINSSGPR